jgi:hypothetical protein
VGWLRRLSAATKEILVHQIHKLNRVRLWAAVASICLPLALLGGIAVDANSSQAGGGPANLTVEISWPERDLDVDMEVYEPSLPEPCTFRNKDTRNGGHLEDVTHGGGNPEKYTISRGPSGIYQVRLKMFTRNRASDNVTVRVTCNGASETFRKRVEHPGNPEGLFIANYECDERGMWRKR